MQTLTYRQAYDKIIEAYFKDEIKPFLGKFCFCGTLAPNEHWDQANGRDEKYNYSRLEYQAMEYALIAVFDGIEYVDVKQIRTKNETFFVHEYVESLGNEYEDLLFKGMCAALDVLKEIHRSRGENVDEEIPAFTKRELKQLIQ